MSYNREFITWQPVLTDHQAFTYQELSNLAGAPVTAYVTSLEDATRRMQGWADTQVASIERKQIPSKGFFRYCYRQLRTHRNDVHLFASAFGEIKMTLCFLMAVWLGVECYLISEPYSPVSFGYFSDRVRIVDKLKSRLRPMLYRLYILALRRKLFGIFAISRRALAQYQTAGMPPGKLFPFGYFIPQTPPLPQPPVSVSHGHAPALRIVFVGSLIPRKGLPILINAVQHAIKHGSDVKLDVFGPGDPKMFDIDGQWVRYCGKIPFGCAQEKIKGYDLMVLPSHYDGWGVVVNEALCAGVPVICSDQVGARVLLETFGAGATFSCDDAHDLGVLLSTLYLDRDRLLAMQHACATAAAAIQPSVAASYMLDVIRAPRSDKALIPSPWYCNQK